MLLSFLLSIFLCIQFFTFRGCVTEFHCTLQCVKFIHSFDLKHQQSFPSHLMMVCVFSDLFQSPNEVFSFKRRVDLSEMKSSDSGAHMFLRGGLRSSQTPKQHNCVALLSANQVVRALPPSKVPLKEVYPKGQRSDPAELFTTYCKTQMWTQSEFSFCPSDVTPPMTAAYLEVTDLNSKKVKYIPVPR